MPESSLTFKVITIMIIMRTLIIDMIVMMIVVVIMILMIIATNSFTPTLLHFYVPDVYTSKEKLLAMLESSLTLKVL